MAEETAVRSRLRSVIPTCVENAWKNGEFLAAMMRERSGAPQGPLAKAIAGSV